MKLKLSTTGDGFHQLELIAENQIETTIIQDMRLYQMEIEAFGLGDSTGLIIHFNETEKRKD